MTLGTLQLCILLDLFSVFFIALQKIQENYLLNDVINAWLLQRLHIVWLFVKRWRGNGGLVRGWWG